MVKFEKFNKEVLAFIYNGSPGLQNFEQDSERTN